MSNKGGNKRSVNVVLYENETLDHALRRLKRKLKMDNMIPILRKNESFISPSEEKRMKKRRKKFSDGRQFTDEKKIGDEE